MLNSFNKFTLFTDKIDVKKKEEGSAQQRVSAMLLGGALCSKESSKYAGPLFARKKPNYLGKFFVFLFVVGVVLGFWERGRKSTVAFVASFISGDASAERALASEGAAEQVEVEIPQEEVRKFHRHERK